MLIPIYKRKGDILDCGNSRGIKLTEHALKILERVIDQRLRKLVKIHETQHGFVKGKGTVDAVFIMRQLQEKALEGNEKLYCAFVDLEKAYDRVPREIVYWCLRKKGVPERLIQIIRNTYEGSKTMVRTTCGNTEEFEVHVGLHQGSALSPLLFVIVMDVISTEVESREVWELLYADDLVITATTKEELQTRLMEWQRKLECRGMKVNSDKSEVMVCRKSGDEELQIQDANGQTLNQVKQFRYLGSVLQDRGGCEKEVKERVKSAWQKWREVAGVVCDRRMPRRLKLKIYKTVIRPVLMYGSETWALRKREERMLERTEMRMLRWIMGISLRERRRNEDIRQLAEIACISEKIREARLRWFGKVMQSGEASTIQKALDKPISGKRSRGRQKLRWRDVVRSDLEIRGLSEEDAKIKRGWRRKIKTADP